ncbi:MAG: hypothetical protein Tsb0032_28520 [Kiloniellaceae bacterium]
MDNTINNPGSVTTPNRPAKTQPQAAAPVDRKAAAPEKVETAQATPAAATAQKPALKQAAPNSALTTYKDQESGRLIVRVFDRESGDVLVEFPPERAFRSATEVLEKAAAKPKKSFSV